MEEEELKRLNKGLKMLKKVIEDGYMVVYEGMLFVLKT